MTTATTTLTDRTATVNADPAADTAARPPTGTTTVTRPSASATVQDLLVRRAALPGGQPDRTSLRNRAIEAGLPLARRLAAAYRGRGEPLDDLEQVAALALVRAVDGYDPARQVAFSSYAVPSITGALKRHFRDSTWRVRVPRGIKDLAVSLASTSARLAQQLGRSPTLQELAAGLDASEADVTVALNSWLAHHPDSLDALTTTTGGEQRPPLIDTIAAADSPIEAVTNRHALRSLLAALTVRQHRILAMRFFEDMTQTEIADQIGVSQMHVSRLLSGTLAQLRAGMLADEPPAPGAT